MDDYSELVVKALDDQYFEDADNDVEVYGRTTRYVEGHMIDRFVYAQLGKRVPYQRKRQNKKGYAEEKKFIKCYIEIYKTLEDMDEGDRILIRDENCTIILQR